MTTRDDLKTRTDPPTFRYRIIAWIVILFARTMRWRLDSRGVENIPSDGGAVVTWQHHSHMDFVISVWDIYMKLGRQVHHLAKAELWDSKAFGWVPRFADAIPVDRGTGGSRDHALRKAVAALRSGQLVMVAPEGTISESFEPLPFATGAVRMAQLAGVPVIPSVEWGSQRLVTTGHRVSFRRAFGIPVTVLFGEPLHIRPDDDIRVKSEELRERTTALLHEAQESYPDGAPAGAWWVPARLGGGAPTHEEFLASHARRRRDRDTRK